MPPRMWEAVNRVDYNGDLRNSVIAALLSFTVRSVCGRETSATSTRQRLQEVAERVVSVVQAFLSTLAHVAVDCVPADTIH